MCGVGKQMLTRANFLQVYHIDFCTPEFKLKVFTSIPVSSAAYAACSYAIGHSPDAAMAGVVADPAKLGYGKLYIMFLEYSKAVIANAFRIMGNPDNYPMMIHCIHGCASLLACATLHGYVSGCAQKEVAVMAACPVVCLQLCSKTSHALPWLLRCLACSFADMLAFLQEGPHRHPRDAHQARLRHNL